MKGANAPHPIVEGGQGLREAATAARQQRREDRERQKQQMAVAAAAAMNVPVARVANAIRNRTVPVQPLMRAPAPPRQEDGGDGRGGGGHVRTCVLESLFRGAPRDVEGSNLTAEDAHAGRTDSPGQDRERTQTLRH